MKKPNKQKSNMTESNSKPMVVTLLAGLLVIGVIWVAFMRPMKAPASQECVQCHHLFAPGTGKTVELEDAAGNKANVAFCQEHRPKIDRATSMFYHSTGNASAEFGNPSFTRYFVAQPAWKEVNQDGSEKNPHVCPTDRYWQGVEDALDFNRRNHKCPECPPCTKSHISDFYYQYTTNNAIYLNATNMTIFDAVGITNSTRGLFWQ